MAARPAAGPTSVLTASRSEALSGTARIPGDKSISHRALILGGLAEGESVIAGLLESDDVLRTARAVKAFGARVERFGPGRWRLFGTRWRSPQGPVDCGNSATTARLLIGAAAGFALDARFTGDRSLQSRPMARLTAPLGAMGARFEGGDTLPLRLSGGGLAGIHFVNRPVSAQVKSAILLAGLRAEGEVTVTEPVASRDHSEILLRRFGVDVERDGRTVRLGPRREPRACLVTIPTDPSSAAFALCAAALVPGSQVAVSDMLLNPLRSGFVMALQRLGGDVALSDVRGRDGETIGSVRVRHAPLFAADFTAEEIPSMIDEIPALAMLAACARGETRIEGLAELRHKESDRLAALARGLSSCGIDAREDGDALVVSGGPVRGGATIDCRQDHRIAMAFLVLGLAAEQPIRVTGAEIIATSFPQFGEAMRALGARIGSR